MKLRIKAVIFLTAVLISFVGFSLIASPFVDILTVGKEAGYEQISNFLARSDVSTALKSSEG